MKLFTPLHMLAWWLLASNSYAQTAAPALVSAGMELTDDSDGFQEVKPWAQYEASNGWGLRAGWQHYALGNWSTTGRSLQLSHRYHQGKTSSQARVGVSQTAGHQHLVGMWDWMRQLSPSTAVGWSMERDVVNSQRGLDRGLHSTTALAVLDHTFNAHLSVGLAAGSTWFSDDNRRDIFRSRWTWTLSKARGVYGYVATRHYQNSAPYQGAYFAPERLREGSIGLMWKHALNDRIVISTHADWGRQNIDGDGQQMMHWGLYLASPHHASVQWKIGLSTSQDRSSSVTGGQSEYRYTSAVANLRLPF